MMRKNGFETGLLLGILLVMSSCAAEPQWQALPTDRHPIPTAYEGWRVGVQAYSFKEFTFFEAIDKAAALGVRWLEGSTTQKICAEWGDVKFCDMNAMQQIVVKRKLADAGLTVINYGVVDLTADEAQCRKIFEFARAMGIETLGAEPEQSLLPMVDRLAQEYKIKVAIHNHPKPSRYWNPETVLAACKGRSEYIGVCADTGHWMRSGVDPVGAIRLLKGKILSVHLKDLNEFGNPKAHDVPWGTGAGQIALVLKELDRQGFKGMFAAEYEYHWENSVPELQQCMAYFNKTAAALKKNGWHDLLADGLKGFQFSEAGWTFQKDAPRERKEEGASVYSRNQYTDFILDLEFKVGEKANSGVFFRVADLKDEVQTGVEVQIMDSNGAEKPGRHDCGAIYDCLAPSENAVRPAGQWNRMTITAVKNKIYVVMNGKQIIDMDLNQWTTPHRNPDGSENKFNMAYKNMTHAGFVGFQNYDWTPVWYRSIWIKTVP